MKPEDDEEWAAKAFERFRPRPPAGFGEVLATVEAEPTAHRTTAKSPVETSPVTPDFTPAPTHAPKPDDDLKPLEPKTPLQAYRLARLNATVYGTWQICWFKRCRRKKKCLGGPRGTFKAYGKPVCVVNGDEAR